MKKHFSKIIKGIALTLLLLLLYVGSYAWNSSAGGYWNELVRDGRHRLGIIPLTTATLWQPRYGYWTPFGGDWIGTFYSPLIRLDRDYIHKTIYIFDPDFEERCKSIIHQLHPLTPAKPEKTP